MFCPACGNNVAPRERFCRVCGKDVSLSGGTPGVPGSITAAESPPETSRKALLRLFSGLFVFFFPASILAVIFGHLSLSDIGKSAGRLKGRGMAITGLV